MLSAALVVALFLSNGSNCNGGPVATSSAITPAFKVSVCVTSDVSWCGLTYRFERINSAGTIRVKGRTLFLATEPNAATAMVYPFAIGTGAGNLAADLGAVRSPHGALPAGQKMLVATYSLSVIGSKPATDYGFRLTSESMIAVDPAGGCGALSGGTGPTRFDPISLPADAPVAAEFTLRKK